MKSLKGFTLVELVLVIAILGILALVLGPVISSAVRGYDVVWSRKETLSEVRAALDRMVKEIRLIPSSAQITNVSSNSSFTFQYPAGTSITYDLSGGNLRRNSTTYVDNVSSLDFRYYDSAGSETAVAANVRRVQISLTTTAPNNHGSISLRTNVFIRNTGNAYSNFALP